METKKHLLSQKKVQGAVNSLSMAIAEIEKANELLDSSIAEDYKRTEVLESQIKSISEAIEVTQATILNKTSEKSRNELILSKLKEFTV